MDNKKVSLQSNGHDIITIFMGDEEGSNALSIDLMGELRCAINEAESKKPKVLILRGLPMVFSSGASKELLLSCCLGDVINKHYDIFERLIDFPTPVIAAMEGSATGGGLILGLCCDMVVMALDSRYGATFMNLGITPGVGSTALLAECFGGYVAAEMMFTGRTFRGSELLRCGAGANRIIPKDMVLAEAMDMALQISPKDGDALRILKGTLSVHKRKLFIDAIHREELMHRICMASPSIRQTIEDNYIS